MASGFLYDPRFLEHQTGTGHPESPERLVAVMALLEQQSFYPQLKHIEGKAIELKWLETIHSAEYIQRVKESCESELPFIDSPDVPVCPKSFEIARLAAGSALSLADAVMSGEVTRAFGLIRPPGHHAERGHAMGFCLFNNIAILARYLQQAHDIKKVAIIDWDVHHGNGSQHSFQDDPSVYYLSLHQFPHYPGTGLPQERGEGKARRTLANIPMQAGSRDEHYQEAFRQIAIPALDAFQPDFVLISAGFDAHEADPLGEIALSTSCFGWMTEELCKLADRWAKGRLVSLLEGGYHLQSLAQSVSEHLRALHDHQAKEK